MVCVGHFLQPNIVSDAPRQFFRENDGASKSKAPSNSLLQQVDTPEHDMHAHVCPTLNILNIGRYSGYSISSQYLIFSHVPLQYGVLHSV